MSPAKIDTWIWVLLYGGLLALCLGVFVLKGGGMLAWPLVVVGVLAVVLGCVLIVVRARMTPNKK